MDDQRIISPQKCSFDESDSDRNLRPPSLSEFTGQDDIKESLSIAIEAAKHRGDSLDHCLFAGPPGLGKTTLSSIIAKEMGVNIHITSGPVLEKASDLAELLIPRLTKAADERLLEELIYGKVQRLPFFYGIATDFPAVVVQTYQIISEVLLTNGV